MAVTLYQFHSRSCQDLSQGLLKLESQSVKLVSKKGIYFDETSSEDSDGSRRASVESKILLSIYSQRMVWLHNFHNRAFPPPDQSKVPLTLHSEIHHGSHARLEIMPPEALVADVKTDFSD